ncbi:MAG TPA: hypothetical protein VMV69_03040 [Pirellulales bacterium]|nr:hypothetical protein [Pirellulales bacterium]
MLTATFVGATESDGFSDEVLGPLSTYKSGATHADSPTIPLYLIRDILLAKLLDIKTTDQVLDALWDEYHAEGKGDLFDELKAVIVGQPVRYADMAARLRRSEGAIKVAVHRLRHRYREGHLCFA